MKVILEQMMMTKENIHDAFIQNQTLLMSLAGQYGNQLLQEKLNLQEEDFKDLLSSGNTNLDLFHSLSVKLGYNLDTILYSEIDQDAVKKFLDHEPMIIPERYIKDANSSRLITKVILQVIRDLYGDLFTDDLLRTFQTTPNCFEGEELKKMINTQFHHDLFYAVKVQKRILNIKNIGMRVMTHYISQMPQLQQLLKLPIHIAGKVVFETFVASIDKSHQWEVIEANEQIVRVRKIPNEATKEVYLKHGGKKNVMGCEFIMGQVEGFLHHFPNVLFHTTEEKCYHLDHAPYCEFVFRLNEGTKQPSSSIHLLQ